MFLYFFSLFLILESVSITSLWMALEINLLIFLLLMKKLFNKNFQEQFFSKYFLTQSILSLLLIFNLMLSSSKMMAFILIIMKMGIPPFHFWLMFILKNLELNQFIILSNLQKFPYLIILFNFNTSTLNFNFIILMESLIMFILVLPQEKTFMIFFFISSMNYWIWTIFLSKINIFLSFSMIFCYSMLNFMFLKKLKYLNQSFLIFPKKFNELFWIWISGFPPFFLFFMKIFFFIFLTKLNFFFSLTILLMNSIIFLLIYFKIFSLKPISNKNYFKTLNNPIHLMEMTMFWMLSLMIFIQPKTVNFY